MAESYFDEWIAKRFHLLWPELYEHGERRGRNSASVGGSGWESEHWSSKRTFPTRAPEKNASPAQWAYVFHHKRENDLSPILEA